MQKGHQVSDKNTLLKKNHIIIRVYNKRCIFIYHLEIIDLKNTECPNCEKTKWMKKEGEIICEKCGLVIRTPYPYVAGIKINTSLKTKIMRKKIK